MLNNPGLWFLGATVVLFAGIFVWLQWYTKRQDARQVKQLEETD